MKKWKTTLESNPLQGYFTSLDGLRGISILLVVLNHFIIPLPSSIEFFRERGHLGVEIFFAISGFLVMRSLHICLHRQNWDFKNALYEFFVRRMSRIFFPYYLTLTLIFLLSFFVSSLSDKIQSIQDIIWSFPFYFYNYAKTYTVGQVPGAFNIMWSLSFEEQFYLLLGIVVLICRRHLTYGLFLLGLGSLFYRLLLTFLDPEVLFFKIQMFTHLRLDAIVWGCILYLLFSQWDSRAKTGNGLFLMVSFTAITTFLLGKIYDRAIENALVFGFTSLTFTLFVGVIVSRPSSFLSRFFMLPFLVYVGRISYEIYLIHQLVNAVIIKFGVDRYPVVYAALFVGLSIAFAGLFFRFVSAPIQSFIRNRLIPSS